MKRILILVALTVSLVAGIDKEKAKKELHDYRVRSQNLHLDELEEQVSHLEDKLHKLSALPEMSRVKKLKARVRNLEGSGCDDADHVQCGGDVPECISHLLVCDGIKDCKNGRDEEDEVCNDVPYKVGTTISGITSWTDCVNHSPHMTVITITASFKREAYTARAYVRAVVSFEVDEHSHLVQSFNAKGYWNPGKRALVLAPETGEDAKSIYGKGIICKFNLGGNDLADCKIGFVASKHTCAVFRGSRH